MDKSFTIAGRVVLERPGTAPALRDVVASGYVGNVTFGFDGTPPDVVGQAIRFRLAHDLAGHALRAVVQVAAADLGGVDPRPKRIEKYTTFGRTPVLTSTNAVDDSNFTFDVLPGYTDPRQGEKPELEFTFVIVGDLQATPLAEDRA